jgi:hypothetical protein
LAAGEGKGEFHDLAEPLQLLQPLGHRQALRVEHEVLQAEEAPGVELRLLQAGEDGAVRFPFGIRDVRDAQFPPRVPFGAGPLDEVRRAGRRKPDEAHADGPVQGARHPRQVRGRKRGNQHAATIGAAGKTLGPIR